MPGKKKKVNVNRTVIWILHIGYWLLFMLLLALFYSFLVLVPGFDKITHSNGFNFWVRLMTGFAMVPAIIAFYVFYGYLFNRFLAKRKFILFCLAGVLVSFLAAIIGAVIASLPIFYGPGFLFGDGFGSAFTILLLMSFGAAVNGIIGAIIKGFISWYNDIKLKEELQQKNYEMELNLVKAQVEPHFLFNTLNNIDVMIEHDSLKASAYVKKLSHILRFMLYESKIEKIPLEKELEYIEKYIQLQQLRSANADYVHYAVNGKANDLMIEPMLFIPFIENAFKHAGGKKIRHAIKIQFELSPAQIRFFCTNAMHELPAGEKEFGGLGNDLIKRRIELLYPNQHTFAVNRTAGTYSVQLTINTRP